MKLSEVSVLEGLLIVFYLGPLVAFSLNYLASIFYFLLRHARGTLKFLMKTLVLLVLALSLVVTVMLCAVPGIIYFVLNWLIYRFGASSVSELDADSSTSGKDVVVHLVHGTFESNAPWTRSGSLLREAIRKRNPGVVFNKFVWSGGNRESSREKAVDELATQIEQNPSNYQFIVAHSHGGNIVKRLSIKHPEVARKIRGAALLSTPFILKKPINRTAKEFGSLHIFGLVVLLQILSLGFWIGAGFDPHDFFIPGLAGFIFAMLIDLVIGRRIRERLLSELTAAPDSGQVDFRNVQLFHAIGDEADAALRISGILHEVCMSALGDLMNVNKIFRGNIKFVYVISALLHAFLLGLAYLHQGTMFNLYSAILAASLSVLAVWYFLAESKRLNEMSQVLMLAGLPIAVIGYFLNAIKAVAFGDIRYVFYPEAFIHSSETPVGAHHVFKVAPAGDQTLIHSTHSDPTIAMNVASWIESSISGLKQKHM